MTVQGNQLILFPTRCRLITLLLYAVQPSTRFAAILPTVKKKLWIQQTAVCLDRLVYILADM